MLKYSQPPTFLNLRGHPSSNLSVEVLTQLPLCSLDTTQHVPMFPAGRVSTVTRILLGYYTYTVVYSHMTYISMFMIGDGVLTVSIQMSGWFLCMQAKLVASATSNLCEAYGVMNSIVATKDAASPLLLSCSPVR